MEKSGGGVTVRLTVVVCDGLPPASAPVIVSVEVPTGVVLEVETFSVEEPEPPLIVDGLKFPVAPAGSPLTLRPTVSANPLLGLTVTV
jgi:hypothetical protein